MEPRRYGILPLALGLESSREAGGHKRYKRAAALDISDRPVRLAIGLACEYCRSYVRGAETGEFMPFYLNFKSLARAPHADGVCSEPPPRGAARIVV